MVKSFDKHIPHYLIPLLGSLVAFSTIVYRYVSSCPTSDGGCSSSLSGANAVHTRRFFCWLLCRDAVLRTTERFAGTAVKCC